MSPFLVSFQYVLSRSKQNEQVGIKIGPGLQGLTLYVCEIADRGLVHAKNRRLQDQAPECSEQQLRVGDEILRVNNSSDPVGMKQQLRTASKIHMKVKRTTPVDNQMQQVVPLAPPTHTVPPPPPPPPPDDSNRLWFWGGGSQTWIAWHGDNPPQLPPCRSRPPSPQPQPEPAEEVAPNSGVCTWVKYTEPVSQNIVFWNDTSGDFFFRDEAINDVDCPWSAYRDGRNRLWYCNCRSGEWFGDGDAAVVHTSPWNPQGSSESDEGHSSPWEDESRSDSDTVHAVHRDETLDIPPMPTRDPPIPSPRPSVERCG